MGSDLPAVEALEDHGAPMLCVANKGADDWENGIVLGGTHGQETLWGYMVHLHHRSPPPRV